MNYYNEIDGKGCAWIRELIAEKLIPEGEIDSRSIIDVQPGDLDEFTQCHFFAGIGGWPYALRLAGWSEGREVWTGSCPCQPLSCAGKQRGHADERHLWPAFYRLIAECRPAIIFGEQVASKDGREWFAGIRADLEGMGYACGGADLCAASVGAPHIRQRLYWMAHAQRDGGRPDEPGRGSEGRAADGRDCEVGGLGHTTTDRCEVQPQLHAGNDGQGSAEGCEYGRLAHAELPNGRPEPEKHGDPHGRNGSGRCRNTDRLADSPSGGQRTDGSAPGQCGHVEQREQDGGMVNAVGAGLAGRQPDLHTTRERNLGLSTARPDNAGFWATAIWHGCRDQKARRISPQPALFPLAARLPGRVGLLRGAGNAIVPELAAQFIQAAEEAIKMNKSKI